MATAPFKDSVGKVWELADPVISPAYTPGLEGTPNELKLKYLADNDFASLQGEELRVAIVESIPPQGRRPQGQHGFAGHHAAQADRS